MWKVVLFYSDTLREVTVEPMYYLKPFNSFGLMFFLNGNYLMDPVLCPAYEILRKRRGSWIPR